MNAKITTISVRPATKQKIAKLGAFNENWDSLLSRLADMAEGRIR